MSVQRTNVLFAASADRSPLQEVRKDWEQEGWIQKSDETKVDENPDERRRSICKHGSGEFPGREGVRELHVGNLTQENHGH